VATSPQAPDRKLAMELVRTPRRLPWRPAAGWPRRQIGSRRRGRRARCGWLLASVQMDGIVVIGEGREGQRPHALQRRTDRRRLATPDRHRGRSDRRDDPDCGWGGAGRWRSSPSPSGAPCSTPGPASTWRNWPWAPGQRRLRYPAVTHRESPRPPLTPWVARCAISQPSSSTESATRTSSPRSDRPGPRIRLITDGDVAGAIATGWPGAGTDILFGIGGTPEGVLARRHSSAWVAKYRAGSMPGTTTSGLPRWPRATTSKPCSRPTISSKVTTASSRATGVTDGELLQGVRFHEFGATTQSLVMRSKSGTLRTIHANHALHKLSEFSSVSFV